MRAHWILLLAPCSASLAQEPAEEPPAFDQELADALTQGSAWLRLNYRHENVDQDGFAQEANASTLRSVLGYRSGVWRNFSGTLEFEDVSVVGGGERYNSLSNGNTDFPVVPDPKGGEVNQAYVDYVGWEDARLRLGRQQIVLGNQRFVSNVGWRQNHQTFDGASLTYSGLEDWELFYAYVGNVNRVLGEDHPIGDESVDAHLIHADRKLADWGTLTAYAYLLDFSTSQALSTNTLGLRFAGGSSLSDSVDALYELEYADQSDTGDNPNEVDSDYLHASVGVGWEGFTARLGHEALGGSGQPGDKFSTPFALLHGFNGWADLFLNTPDTGLLDTYATLQWREGDWNLQAWFHDFEADAGGASYGSELDLLATYALTPRLTLGAKYASYNSDGFATDTDKLWGWVTYSLALGGD